MSAAIPMGVALAAGGTATAMGASSAMAMNISMLAMATTQLIMAGRQQNKKTGYDYAHQTFTARADNTPLPRLWGTARLPSNLVWFGNLVEKKSNSKQAKSKLY